MLIRQASRALALVFLLLSSAAAIAALSGAEPVTYFLKPDAIDVVALLPAPPAKGTPEAASELAVVLQIQATRTKAEGDRAKSEDELGLPAFTSVVGPWFTPANLPKTEAFFKHLDLESKQFTKVAKAHFARPRPPAEDTRVTPLIEETGMGYPSGHSTRGTIFALVLTDLFPDLKEKLQHRGEEIGWDRVIAGVHYPSDVVTGRVLGKAIAQALLKSPEFRAELEKLKPELEAAHKAADAATPAPAKSAAAPVAPAAPTDEHNAALHAVAQ